MIRLLFAFILILSSICACDTDKKSPPETIDSHRIERDTTQSKIEKPKLLGDDLFKYPEEPPIPKTSSVNVNDYLCEIKESADGKQRCLTFSRNGKKIRSDCSEIGFFSILMSPPAGTDINGDGIPDIIVEYYSGGAHCCFQYSVFSLGDRMKLVAVLNGEHSVLEFKDLDGDGKHEVIGRDWTFAYWYASFAGSPAPEIILHWNNGKYRLSEDLMKKTYDLNDVRKTAEEFRRDALPESESNQSLHWEARWWAAMLELIYSGNGDIAWKFFDWFWPVPDEKSLKEKWLTDKKKFLAEFKKQLRMSPYWIDLKKLNGWQ